MNNCKKCGHDSFEYRLVNMHLGQYCAKCDAHQQWISQNKPMKTMPFGKYKGEIISEINDYQYLGWLEQSLSATEENKSKFPKLIEALRERLKDYVN
jgi:uncharacterized protein (DUF3820 family)